jgi:hypothetical protein
MDVDDLDAAILSRVRQCWLNAAKIARQASLAGVRR